MWSHRHWIQRIEAITGLAWRLLRQPVTTKEQHCVLQMNKKEQEKIDDFDDILKITAYNIEKAAFERMKDLDEKTASTARPTITGLGN
jgi:hypothetical protein